MRIEAIWPSKYIKQERWATWQRSSLCSGGNEITKHSSNTTERSRLDIATISSSRPSRGAAPQFSSRQSLPRNARQPRLESLRKFSPTHPHPYYAVYSTLIVLSQAGILIKPSSHRRRTFLLHARSLDSISPVKYPFWVTLYNQDIQPWYT